MLEKAIKVTERKPYTHLMYARYLDDLVICIENHAKWNWLYEQLAPGMEAGEDEFVPFDAESIIATAKKQKAENAS